MNRRPYLKHLLLIFVVIFASCSKDEEEVNVDSLGVWIEHNDFPGAGRAGGLTFVLDGKGYWGFGATTEGYLRDIWSYDPITDSWERKNDFPFDPGEISLTIGNKAYVITYSGSLFEYKPELDEWIYLSSFPPGNRPGITGFALEGKAYLGTGNNVDSQNFTVFKDFWLYDPSTNEWTQIEDFPGTARTTAQAFIINNKGYIGLGFNGLGAPPIYNDFYSFDPLSMTWTKVADFPVNNSLPGIVFSSSSKGYIGLPENNQKHLGEVYEFNPITNIWRKVSMFPNGNSLSTNSFNINNRMYVIGGWGSDYSKQVWEFVP